MRSRIWAALAAGALVAPLPLSAATKSFTSAGYALPAGKAVTVVVMRPDVEVGLLQAGGVPEPNADWTRAARENLAAALEANQKARNIEVKYLDENQGDAARLVGDYEALHQAVAGAILQHRYYGAKLPTKKRKGKAYVFDWTMGPGAQALGDLTGANYGLFLFTRDNFASAGRQAMQALGLLGCVVGFCTVVSGGQHVGYASLVELSTGNIVWFNVLRGSAGDIREKDGARAMVDTLMASMPARPGEGGNTQDTK